MAKRTCASLVRDQLSDHFSCAPGILPCDFCESYVVRPLQIKSVVKSVRIPNSAVLKTFLEMIYICADQYETVHSSRLHSRPGVAVKETQHNTSARPYRKPRKGKFYVISSTVRLGPVLINSMLIMIPKYVQQTS